MDALPWVGGRPGFESRPYDFPTWWSWAPSLSSVSHHFLFWKIKMIVSVRWDQFRDRPQRRWDEGLSRKVTTEGGGGRPRSRLCVSLKPRDPEARAEDGNDAEAATGFTSASPTCGNPFLSRLGTGWGALCSKGRSQLEDSRGKVGADDVRDIDTSLIK